MSLLLICACFASIIGIYFYNNPLEHGRWFMVRRLINWLPLGMTYGVTLRLAELFWAGFGLVCYGLLASRTGAPSADPCA